MARTKCAENNCQVTVCIGLFPLGPCINAVSARMFSDGYWRIRWLDEKKGLFASGMVNLRFGSESGKVEGFINFI